MIPSNPESSSVSLSAEDDGPGTLPEVLSPHRASNSSQEEFPLPSSLANILENTTDSESEEETDRKSCKESESESENEVGSKRKQRTDGNRLDSVGDDDGDEDKDYDEVVVKPRPLNEVTSLTDKTSPWTSVLSDLDMASLESAEETNEALLSPADGEKSQTLNQQTPKCGEQHGCEGQDANRSAGSASDAGHGQERTTQTEKRRPGKGSDMSHENSLSPDKQVSAVNHDAPSSSQDQQPQVYPSCVFCVFSSFFLFLICS